METKREEMGMSFQYGPHSYLNSQYDTNFVNIPVFGVGYTHPISILDHKK